MSNDKQHLNIFFLDWDPKTAARDHNNRHVAKMIRESVEIMTLAHYNVDGLTLPVVRVTAHVPMPLNLKDHPCVIWAMLNTANYRWLHDLATALCYEYEWRYRRRNPLVNLVQALTTAPSKMPIAKTITPPTQWMPPVYRRGLDEAVEAYRDFYFSEKKHLAEWSIPSGPPDWWRMREEAARKESVQR